MIKLKIKTNKFKAILHQHIINNKRGYCLAIILFFVGLLVGIISVNHVSNIEDINQFYSQFTDTIKEFKNIDYFVLLKHSIFSNFIQIILLWIGASTIIGIPIVYGSVLYKGFSIGYTISSLIIYFGMKDGIVFSIVALFLHNFILIPAILGASVSGIKLYQSIMKKKNKENIKTEVIRHTLFCTIMFAVMSVSSLIEVYVSTNLIFFLIKK